MSTAVLVGLGVLLALWTCGAVWAIYTGLAMRRTAASSQRMAKRLNRMIDHSPMLPLLIRGDGRIEGPEKLAQWLGLVKIPQYLSEISSEGGISSAELATLSGHISKTQRTGEPFEMPLKLPQSTKWLKVRGVLADPQTSPGGAALLWFYDATSTQTQISELTDQLETAKTAFASLVALIDAAPMPMWFRGPDLKLSLVNSAYVKAVEGQNADTVVDSGQELLDTIDGESPKSVAARALDEGQQVERVVPATLGGRRRTVRVIDLPIKGRGVAGYAIDIQEVEDARGQLRRFTEMQRAMMDIMASGVAQFDAQQSLVFSNQPFARTFGLRPEWTAEQPEFARLLDRMRESGRLPEIRDFPGWRAEHQSWFRLTEPTEESWMLRDGTHLRVIAQPSPDGGLVLIFEDRTEQVQLASARDTLLRTRTATFDNLFEALAVFSPDGRVTLWNRPFTKIWGLEEDALDGHPRADDLLKMVSTSLKRTGHIAILRDVIRGATLDRSEETGRTELKNGRIVEFAGVPLPDGNGLLTVLDITDSENVQTALRERNQALEEADKLKERFLANMSYEFRTPLTSIGGFAEMLGSGLAGDLSEQGREYVAAILDSVQRLTSQIENVLDMTQSEAGTLPLDISEVELRPLVSELMDARKQKIRSSGLGFRFSCDIEKPVVQADRRRLLQAIGQLLDNSISATSGGGQVLLHIDKQGKYTRIIVSDDGPGMTLAEINRVLEGYGDGSGSDKKRANIGLPLTKRLIEMHGGKLEVASEPGQGTMVSVLLP